MKSKLLFLAAALLFCGGLQAGNAEDTKQQIAQIKTWQADVGWKFNRSALHGFLQTCIAGNKSIESVDITKIPLGDSFTRSGGAYYYAGDWVFVTKDEENKVFEFRANLGKAGWAVFTCERENKKAFKLVKAYIDKAPHDAQAYPKL